MNILSLVFTFYNLHFSVIGLWTKMCHRTGSQVLSSITDYTIFKCIQGGGRMDIFLESLLMQFEFSCNFNIYISISLYHWLIVLDPYKYAFIVSVHSSPPVTPENGISLKAQVINFKNNLLDWNNSVCSVNVSVIVKCHLWPLSQLYWNITASSSQC